MKTSEVLRIVREQYLDRQSSNRFICLAMYNAFERGAFDYVSFSAARDFLKELGMGYSLYEFATIKYSDRQKVRWAWLYFAEQVAKEEGK